MRQVIDLSNDEVKFGVSRNDDEFRIGLFADGGRTPRMLIALNEEQLIELCRHLRWWTSVAGVGADERAR